MAHFALLENNIVKQVVVIDNKDIGDLPFPESEVVGKLYIASILKIPGIWIQTSYNDNFRNKYARVGWKYDSELDAFIPQQPFPSWVFNNQTMDWDAPVENTIEFNPEMEIYWDEPSLSWKERPIYSAN